MAPRPTRKAEPAETDGRAGAWECHDASMEHFHQVQEDLRGPSRDLRQAIPDVMAARGTLHTAAFAEGALPAKVKELVALSIAITRECDGCIASHARGAVGAVPAVRRWPR